MVALVALTVANGAQWLRAETVAAASGPAAATPEDPAGRNEQAKAAADAAGGASGSALQDSGSKEPEIGADGVVRGADGAYAPPGDAKPGRAEHVSPEQARVSTARPPRDPARRVEVESMRTETSRTFRNSDGTYTTETFVEPIHAPRPDGRGFDAVDTALGQRRDGKVRTRRGTARVELAESAAGDLATVAPSDDTEVRYSLVGARDVPAQVGGDTASYGEVLPGVDLELQALAGGVKETIVLKDPGAPAEYRFRLGGRGLRPRIVDGGGIEFARPDGTVAATMPPGFAVDAGGATTAKVRYELHRGGDELTVRVDRGWLGHPDRRFPVRVDPTIGSTFTASIGNTIKRCAGASSFPTGRLLIGTSQDVNLNTCDNAALVKWNNLGPLNRGLILDARMQVYNAFSPASCRGSTMTAHPITGSWGTGVTWNSAPGYEVNPVASAYGAYACGGGNGGWMNFPVTGLVQRWADGGANHGVMLRTAYGNPAAYRELSQEDSTTGPRLVVDWTPHRVSFETTIVRQPTRLVDGEVSVIATNHGSSVWDPSIYKLSYRVYDGAGVPVPGAKQYHVSFGAPVGPGQNTGIVAVPIEALPVGTYYVAVDLVKIDETPYLWFTTELSWPAMLRFDVPFNLPQITTMGPAGRSATNTPRLYVYAFDPDRWGSPQGLVYDFLWCENAELTVGCQSANGRSEGALPLSLVWSRTYYWRVSVWSLDHVKVSPTLALTATPVQPEPPKHLGGDTQSVDEGGVSKANGNFTRTFTDLHVDSVGVDLTVRRTFNSLDPRTDLLFGRGFSSPFDARFTDEPATSTMLITHGDGRSQRFGRNPDGTYSAAIGHLQKLEYRPGGGGAPSQLILRNPDGSQLVFDGGHRRVVQMTSATGQRIDLGYVNGQLRQAAGHPSFRSIFFDYPTPSSPHPSRVYTDSVPEHGGPIAVTYTYNGDNLRDVCGPRASTECTTFTWGTDPGDAPNFNRLVKIQSPDVNDAANGPVHARPTVAQLSYRADGTVYRRIDAAGKEWSYQTDSADIAGLYHAIHPQQLLPAGAPPWNPGQTQDITVAGMAGVPGDGSRIQAAVVHIGVLGWGPGASGWVSAWSPDRPEPAVSLASYNPGGALVDQTVTVPVDRNGRFRFKHTSLAGQPAYVSILLVGWYSRENSGFVGGNAYHPIEATRVLDTRAGSSIGGYSSPSGQGVVRRFSVAGNPLLAAKGVPASKVRAVAITVQAVNASATGSISFWPEGTDPAFAIPIIGWAGIGRSSTAIVRVDEAGGISFRPDSGSADLIVDVTGWYASTDDFLGGSYYSNAVDPIRILDSRDTSQVGPYATPWPENGSRVVGHNGFGLLPTDAVTAIDASMTAWLLGPDTYLTAYPTNQAGGTGTSLYLPGNMSAATNVMTKVAGDGAFNLFNAVARTGVILDLYGAFYRKPIATTAIKPDGHQTVSIHDGFGRLRKETDERRETRYIEYDGGTGLLTETIDQTGQRKQYTYDDFGRQRSVTLTGVCPKIDYPNVAACSVIGRTYREYDAGRPLGDPRFDKPVKVRSPRSASATDNTYATTFGYDANGNEEVRTTPATADYPVGRTRLTTYTTGNETTPGGLMPRGLVRTIREKDSSETRFDYDPKGNLIRETGPYPVVAGTPQPTQGLVKEHTYDVLGRRLTTTERSDTFPNGLVTSYAYDKRDVLISTREPAFTDVVNNVRHQRETVRTMDASNNVVSETVRDIGGSAAPDAARTTRYHYDALSRADRIDRPATAVESFTYDDVGNVATRTFGSRVTKYEYTERAELFKTTVLGFQDPNGLFAGPRDLLVESRGYDPAGRLAYRIDAAANRTEFAYVGDGWLAGVKFKEFDNPDGTKRDIVLLENRYDNEGNVKERLTPMPGTTNGSKATTQYTVDAARRLTEIVVDPLNASVNPLRRHTKLSYDPMDRVTKEDRFDESSPRHEVTERRYNHLGQVESETLDAGTSPSQTGVLRLTTTSTYDRRGLLTSTTGPDGSVTTVVNDEARQAATVLAPEVDTQEVWATPVRARPTTAVGFSTFGEAVATKDPKGRISRQAYDAAGRPTVRTWPTYGPQTPTEITGYDPYGNATSTLDRRGSRTDRTFDSLDRLVKEEQPAVPAGRPTTRYWYPDNEQTVPNLVIDPVGVQTLSTVDDLGRHVAEVLVERVPTTKNLTTRFTFDDADNITRVTDPAGAWASTAYNQAGEPIAVNRAKPRDVVLASPTVSDTVTRDFAGRPIAETDALGRKVVRTFDGIGRVRTEQRVAANGTTLPAVTTAYNDIARQETYTDALGHTTVTTADALGQVLSTVQQVSATESITETFGYDAAGNQVRRTDGRNNTFWTTYNTWDLPETVVEPQTAAHADLAQRSFTTVYDAGGLPASLNNAGATRTRTFDALGRLTDETGANGDTPTTAARQLGYDLAGRMTSYSTPAGASTVTYNDRGLPTRVQEPTNTTEYTYDDGGRTTLIRGGPADVKLTYFNERGELDTVQHGTSETATLRYNAAGQVRTRSFGTGGVTTTYGYDDFARSTSEAVARGTTSLRSTTYTYDANDNVKSKTTGPASIPGSGASTYDYDWADRLTRWTKPGGASESYTWDKAGNRTAAGTATFAYDERNRLTAKTDAGVTTTYGWSPRGTLRSTKVGAAAATTTEFDAFDRMVADQGVTYAYDSLDRMRTRNGATVTWEGMTQNLRSEGTQQYTYDANGQPLRAYAGTAYRELDTDRHGDVVGNYQSSTGALTARTFDPWGTVVGETAGNAVGLGYQGDWTDPTTKRVDMNARWYTPGTGSFTARDSVDDPLMRNRYGYTPGNPLRYSDESGHRGAPTAPPGLPDSCPCISEREAIAIERQWHEHWRRWRDGAGRIVGGVGRLLGGGGGDGYDGRRTTTRTWQQNQAVPQTRQSPSTSNRHQAKDRQLLGGGGRVGGLPGTGTGTGSGTAPGTGPGAGPGRGPGIRVPAPPPPPGRCNGPTPANICPRTWVFRETWAAPGRTAPGTRTNPDQGSPRLTDGQKDSAKEPTGPARLEQHKEVEEDIGETDVEPELALADAGKAGSGGGPDCADTTSPLLDDDLIRLAEQHLTNTGDTVLGRFPKYIDKAKDRNASYFDIGDEWNRIIADGIDPWLLNEHFLNVVTNRGDRMLLSLPKGEIPEGGYLSREIQHLLNERGYVWVNQWSLRPRCR